jgi:hypothetical protein
MDMIQADFVKMVDDLVSLKSKAYEKVDTDDDDDKNKKKNKKDDKSDTEKKPKENKE